MIPISIIGAGNLGTNLGAALHLQGGYYIRALSCRTRASAEESRRLIGSGTPMTDIWKAAAESRVVLLTVPDDALAGVAEELAAQEMDRNRVVFLHTSGLLSSHILEALARQGAHTGSLHPMQSFAGKQPVPRHFKAIYFGIEGDAAARSMAQQIARDLGGLPVTIDPENKPLYHTACSIASNLLVPLFQAALSLLQSTDIKHPHKQDLLLPLAQGTLHNVKKFDTEAALTGPLVRGDIKTVRHHIEVLKKFPPILKIYRDLGNMALDMPHRDEKIGGDIEAELRALLEEK